MRGIVLNPVQKAAYELIQADARFLYTLTVIQRNAKNISGNYIMMSHLILACLQMEQNNGVKSLD